MTNKMAARVLTYEQRSPSYGNSKLEKLIKLKKTIALQSLNLVYGEWVSSDVAKNGTIFSSNQWWVKRYLNFLASCIISLAMVL